MFFEVISKHWVLKTEGRLTCGLEQRGHYWIWKGEKVFATKLYRGSYLLMTTSMLVEVSSDVFHNLVSDHEGIPLSDKTDDILLEFQRLCTIAPASLPSTPKKRRMLGKVKSSCKNKWYEIWEEEDGTRSCDCPAFVHGKTRPCKHMNEYSLYDERRAS